MVYYKLIDVIYIPRSEDDYRTELIKDFIKKKYLNIEILWRLLR